MLLNSQKHNPALFKVDINNYSISPKDKLKYLGVLDNKLKLETSCTKETQLSRACLVLSKLKHYTTTSVLEAVYNSLIQ